MASPRIHPTTAAERRRARRRRLRFRALAVLAIAVVGSLVLRRGSDQRLWGRWYRSAPRPVGMVLRAPLDRVTNPMMRIRVAPAELGEAGLRVFSPTGPSGEVRTLTLAYPGGEVRAEDNLPRGTLAPPESAKGPFDFDGDGTPDTVRAERRNWTGRVEVLSGVDARVLFRDDDSLSHENEQRAFPLGDLDGDGFGELALIHPRTDRSRYDFEWLDAIDPPNSWVTVVSGSKLFASR